MFSKSVIAKVSARAEKMNVEAAALLAVAEVEAAGVTSWNVKGKSLPPIRFEGHYFHKKLKGAKLAKAVAQGLANPKAGAVKNPASYSARYALLERAMAIDPKAAMESTSWGLGQVMGDHWKKLGYSSVDELVEDAKEGVDGQIEVMARYIEKFGLVDELQTKGWASFAKQYNGPAYKSNRYDEKMARAYKSYRGLDFQAAEDSPEKGTETVRGIQRDLARLGYYKGKVDGISGRYTTLAVKAFQKDHGLVADGKYGKMTDEALDTEIAKLDAGGAETCTKSGAVTTGVGAACEVVQEQADKLEGFAAYSDIIQYIVMALVLVGIALTIYGLYRKFKTKEAA
jgi:hypothetical protein